MHQEHISTQDSEAAEVGFQLLKGRPRISKASLTQPGFWLDTLIFFSEQMQIDIFYILK